MKNLLSNSSKGVVALFGLAAVLLLTTPCQALSFAWSFVNTEGFGGTTIGATVEGRVLDLMDNGSNYQPVTVTFDSVSTGFDPGFSATSWTAGGVFNVAGGVLTSAQWSTTNATMGINLNTITPPTRGVVSLNDWSAVYQNGKAWPKDSQVPAVITFTSISVPDGGMTLVLLGLGITGLALLRRKLA